MNILVTGGAGFIGSHLCLKLLDNGHKVTVVDNFDPFYDKLLKLENIKTFQNNKNFTLINSNITDRNEMNKLFKANNFDQVVHLAAKAGVRPSIENPISYYKTNLVGTLTLLEAIKDKKIKNFIFISSSSVYGERTKTPFSESDFVDNTISPYGLTKLSGEKLTKIYSSLYSIPTTCLRLFTVYGPRQRPDLAIRKFIDSIYNGVKIEVFGDGSTMRDYTYVDDIVDGILKCIDNPFEYEIINLGNSNPIKLSELIKTIEKNFNKKALIVKKPLQSGDVSVTFASIKKAKKLLNWKPKVKFEKGIERMIKWYLTKYE